MRSDQEPSEDNKKIARAALEAFGGVPNVGRYWDAEERNFVDVVVCKEVPQRGVSSYATIGLSDWVNDIGNGNDIRVELVGACGNFFSGFDNALATAAFCIINSRWPCYPGAIFPDVISEYELSSSMAHLYFTNPFLWTGKLETLELHTKTVAWLLAVPISESERSFADEFGTEKLENLFEQKQIDIFDLNRPSVV